MNLAKQLELACLKYRSSVALHGEDSRLTYAQLWSEAEGLATALRQVTLSANETVMVRVSNHPQDTVAFLAVWLVGGVAVPVHRTAPPAFVEAIQATAMCRLSVNRTSDGAFSIDSLLSQSPPSREVLSGAAIVIFTSGSTGLPKGVVLTHGGLSGKLVELQGLLEFSPQDVVLLVLNNTFSYAVWMTLLTLSQGGRLIVRPRFDSDAFFPTLVRFKVTRVGVVPTMIRSLLSSIHDDELSRFQTALRQLGALRDVIIGGELLGLDLSARLRSFIAPARLFDIYGLTETSTCDFVLAPEDYPAHPDSIGLPAPKVRFRIMRDDGLLAEVKQPGELQLRTPFIMAGYLGAEALTRAAFDDGWFRTGDLAVADPSGFVSIVGRIKEVIVRGGNKITPMEVERALTVEASVAQAAVTGIPDAVLGQRILAVLVPANGVEIDAEALKATLTERLERFKHPDSCFVADALPTGRTGKLDRSSLADLAAAGFAVPLDGWSRSS